MKSVNCVLSVVGFARKKEKVAYRWNGFQRIDKRTRALGSGDKGAGDTGEHQNCQEKNGNFLINS